MSNESSRIDMRGLVTTVLASLIVSSGTVVFNAGKTQQELETIKTNIIKQETKLESNSGEINNLKVHVNGLTTGITRIENGINKLDAMAATINQLDKKITEYMVTQTFIMKDMEDFKVRVQQVESKQAGRQ